MNLLKLIGLALLSSTLLSCSDFFNPKTATKSGDVIVGTATGNNAFDADFDPTSAPFSKEKMLAGIGLQIIFPKVKELRLQLEILLIEIESLRQELEDGEAGLESEKEVLKRWRLAMLAFHQADSFGVGPLNENGALIADQIYSWPAFDPCGLDLQVAELSNTGRAGASMVSSVKGLAALEYLFFEPTMAAPRCKPRNVAHRPAFDWAAKDVKVKKLDRVRYAEAITIDALEAARLLEAAWNPRAGNYSKTLIDGSRYPDMIQATNAMSDSLFAIESVKDIRLGKPLGLHKDCAEPGSLETCPESTEHEWSGLGLKAIEARLLGFQAAFLGQRSKGSKIYGFDDYLQNVGRGEIAEALAKEVAQALKSVKEVDALGEIRAQIEGMDPQKCADTGVENRLVPVCALFQDVRAISTRLKTEFLIALGLQAPAQFQGDND